MYIDQLSRILRLSHAGTVRLVDRLVDRNLVEKRPCALDRRIMSLALTTGGWRQRDELLILRRAALTVLLNQVAPEDLAAPERVAETMAAALPEDALSALTTCRVCDVLDKSGVIRLAFVKEDWSKRLDPDIVVDTLRGLANEK
jgi:DNA-binding MarR family transcriptional regulator